MASVISKTAIGLQQQGNLQVKCPDAPASRDGVATLWVILSLPICLTILVTVIEIGSLWSARSELCTALESAALAGVKTWGDGIEAGVSAVPATSAARQAAAATFAANTVGGTSWTLDLNDSGTASSHGNLSCSGEIILGGMLPGSTAVDSGLAPLCGSGTDVEYCVVTRKVLTISTVCSELFGVPIGPFQISAQAAARAGCTGTGATVANPAVGHISSLSCAE